MPCTAVVAIQGRGIMLLAMVSGNGTADDIASAVLSVKICRKLCICILITCRHDAVMDLQFCAIT